MATTRGSYPAVPREASEQAGTAAAEGAIRSLLADLAGRKELAAYRPPPAAASAAASAAAGLPALYLPGLRLHGAQLFIRGFESPNTPYPRLLIEWQTGTGKSLAAASIGHEFIRQFRARAAVGEAPPAVVFISFTARETIQEELLRHPEFGFVSQAEAEELRRLRAAAAAQGQASAEARQLAAHTGVLRRRITDRARGGHYQFYGYKEFANRLIAVTRQGEARGFDVQALFGRAEGAFQEQLAAAVRRGDVVVDDDLLDSLRGGLLFADEIHNVYNILEPNNYGIAIQYALDVLGDEAPRVVLMSATPETGSAAEVVDLLNLLVPRSALPGGVPLRRADFFTRAAVPGDEGAFVVSALREGALERIGHLSAGRVSYLLDADVGAYPRRIFAGEEVAGVPYLRLTLCPMAPFHERTLAREQAGRPEAAGLAANAYTLYDMAFPNPDFAPDAAEADPAAYGLYQSGETPARLAQAPEAWRAAAGVAVERAGPAGGTAVITGPFLGPDRLKWYSTKVARVVADTIAAVRAGPGKIMIYHHRVRMSGILAYVEALRMHGFADETSAPTDATLCGVCGYARSEHSEHSEHSERSEHSAGPPEGGKRGGHAYAPARLVVAHSDVDRATMMRSIDRYNAPANLPGYQYRVILGSKIVREGLNFRAVRHQFVASLPVDYPTLVQVFGRVVRKDSAAELPESQRDVTIRVYVSARADGRPSPELQRYVDKGREYLVIQQVARARHAYAVDGFANYHRVRAALHAGPGGELAASLDALPYSPVVEAAPAAALRTATFEAYGYGEREVATIAAVCRALFRARPVWTYEDLWAAVRGGAVRGAYYDPALFEEGNFALALASLGRPAGDPPALVARAGPYYVAALAEPGGGAALDVESHLREPPPAAAPVAVRLGAYLREARSDQNFTVRLREYEAAYLAPAAPSALEESLVECGAAFHYALLQRLVVAAGAGGAAVTSDDRRVAKLYRRFRVAVTVADAAASPAFRGAPGRRGADLAGYVTPEAVALYDPAAGAWYSAAHADFGVGRRHRENDVVVGYVTSEAAAPTGAFSAASLGARFKVRLPLQKLRASARGDARSLARGAVCETRPREELQAYVRRLREATARLGGGGERAYSYAARLDAQRFPTAGQLCAALRLHLLALEEAARAPADGLSNGLRWLYLFNDRPPTISALVT